MLGLTGANIELPQVQQTAKHEPDQVLNKKDFNDVPGSSAPEAGFSKNAIQTDKTVIGLQGANISLTQCESSRQGKLVVFCFRYHF